MITYGQNANQPPIMRDLVKSVVWDRVGLDIASHMILMNAVKTVRPAPPCDAQRIANWLFVCCGMIFFMAMLGVVVRLVEAGFAVAVWPQVNEALPPLTAEAWNALLERYQQDVFSADVSLEAFQRVYFWQWLHRLWSHLVGAVLAVPFFYFFARRVLDNAMAMRLATIFALGSMEVFVGWFMVWSGLAERTSVVPVRLTLQLIIAIVAYGLLLWTALGLRYGPAQAKDGQRPLQKLGWGALAALALVMIWGALAAGLGAGLGYNTWPLMGGQLLPDEAWSLTPAWNNFFVNKAMVQFTHRWLGMIAGLVLLYWGYRRLRAATFAATRRWAWALCGAVFIQTGLGIATLLTRTDTVLAAAHQGGAIILLSLLLQNLRRPDRA